MALAGPVTAGVGNEGGLLRAGRPLFPFLAVHATYPRIHASPFTCARYAHSP